MVYKHKVAGTIIEIEASCSEGFLVKIIESEKESDLGRKMILLKEDLDNGCWEDV